MMTFDQMELLFSMLIAQNIDTKICTIFRDFTSDETLSLGDCTIVKNQYESVEIFHNHFIVVRFRNKHNIDSKHERIFVTWNNRGKVKFEEYEQFLSHLLKFVSFEDKV